MGASNFIMAPEAGFEPATWALTVPRSTAELLRNTDHIIPVTALNLCTLG